MNYSEAARINRQSLASLLLNRDARGEDSSVRKAISDKLKAKVTGIKSKLDPLNLIKFLTRSNTLTALAGMATGRDVSDIAYLTGTTLRRTTTAQRLETPEGDAPALTGTTGFSKKTIKLLKKMFAFMQKNHAEDQLFNNDKIKFLATQERLRVMQNDQLVRVFLNGARGIKSDVANTKLSKSRKSGFMKAAFFFGAILLLANAKKIMEKFEDATGLELTSLKDAYDAVDKKIEPLKDEILQFVEDLQKEYKNLETYIKELPQDAATVLKRNEDATKSYEMSNEFAGSTEEMPDRDQPLSVRNLNPGNLRFVGQTGAVKGEAGFAKFQTKEQGLKALRSQLVLDTQTRKMTLEQTMRKYAPENENDTQNYISFLSKVSGVKPTEVPPIESIDKIMGGIIQMEGGKQAVSFYKDSPKPVPTKAEGMVINKLSTDNKSMKQERAKVFSNPPIIVNNTTNMVTNKTHMSMPAVESEIAPILKGLK